VEPEEPAYVLFQELWTVVRGRTDLIASAPEVAKVTGLPVEQADAAYDWLEQEGWVEEAGLGGEIQLTRKGVREGQHLFGSAPSPPPAPAS
jgi:hypothetical protein